MTELRAENKKLLQALCTIDDAYTNYQLINNVEKPFNISKWRDRWYKYENPEQNTGIR